MHHDRLRGSRYALVRVQGDNYEADRSVFGDRDITCDRHLWLAHGNQSTTGLQSSTPSRRRADTTDSTGSS